MRSARECAAALNYSLRLLGKCFCRKVREERICAEYMAEKGVGFTPDNYQTSGQWPKVNHRVASFGRFGFRPASPYARVDFMKKNH